MPNDMLKNIFTVVIAMMISLVLFIVIFGDTGKGVIWSRIEPVLTGHWDALTFNDGGDLGDARSVPFENATDLSNSQ